MRWTAVSSGQTYLVMTFMNRGVVQIECGDSHTLARTQEGYVYILEMAQWQAWAWKYERSMGTKIVSKFNTLARATTKSTRVFPSFSKFLSGGNRQNKDSTDGDVMAENLVMKTRTGIISDQIACGLRHSVIVERNTGHVYAFGYGGNGELGQGPTLVDLHIPTILHPDLCQRGCVTLACGGQHNLAICRPA